jgi:hypothetical protein
MAKTSEKWGSILDGPNRRFLIIEPDGTIFVTC